MFFSIIIPVYNAEKYIKNCIQSIQKQTFDNFECILINDGSTDNSLNILNDIAETDSRFIIINKKNEGVSSARNQGLSKASGDFIIFIDSDDFIEPTLLEILKNNCNDKDIIQYDFYKISSNNLNEYKKEIHIKSNTDFIIQGEGAVVWKRAFRRDFIQDIRFNESLRGGEDYLFCCEAFLKNPRFFYINKCLYNYNTSNTNSAMNLSSINTFIDQLLATKQVESLLKQNNLLSKYEYNLTERYFWCLSEFNNWYLTRRGKNPFYRRLLVKIIKIILKKF